MHRFNVILANIFSLLVLLSLSISTYAEASTRLSNAQLDLTETEEELVISKKRLAEVNEELAAASSKEKAIKSKLLPLQVEGRKLDLERRRIEVKRVENRSREEAEQLSKIKYRAHIIKLKQGVQQDTLNEHAKSVKELHKRKGRLDKVLTRLKRQERGLTEEIARLQKQPLKQVQPANNKAQVTAVTEKPKAKPAKAKVAYKPKSKPSKNKAKKVAAIRSTQAASLVKPTKPLKPSVTANLNVKPKAVKKPDVKVAKFEPTRPSESTAEKAERLRQQRNLETLYNRENLPASMKAVIRARFRALSEPFVEPNLGIQPDVILKNIATEQSSVLAQLNHLGNHQYMNSVVLKAGVHQFIIGSIKFTKHIDKVFDDTRAIVIIDAEDIQNPNFEIYPASKEKPSYFTY